MRIIIVFILLAFGLVTEGKTQRHNDAKTQSEDSATLRLCDSASYYESQIRIADSLYKNYLPQYNFEEVKAAMEFFDSLKLSKDNGDGNGDGNNIPLPTPTSASAIRLQNSILLCAKAHYYHAVGLTEKDDIVGACEHYLTALEIMEEDDLIKRHKDAKTQRRKTKINYNKDNYEKIRFVALIYTRLGEVFYDVNFCDISIVNYKKAFHFYKIIDNNLSEARSLKCIGNAYQLSNNNDSALCYYNESLKINAEIDNKFDIEKCIAQISYDKGEKSIAYDILKNNLKRIDNNNIKYSYHCTLGNMFYIDKEYDSALYYLEKSLDHETIIDRLAFTTKLSAIYDSLGNYEKRAYYDNISSKLFSNNINKDVNKSKIHALYEEYNERNQQKIKTIIKKRTVFLGGLVTILVLSVFITIKNKYKKHSNMLSEEIMAKDEHIKHNEFKNALIEGKIKSKNIELQQKDKQIKSQQLKIAELQSKLENRKDNLKEYYQSEICAKILNEINELSKANKMTSELKPLSQEEFVMLLQSANLHLGEFIKNISDKYPSFKKDDLYYLCLVAINLNDKQIAALFNVTYNAVRSRRKKICSYLDIDINENIYKKLII